MSILLKGLYGGYVLLNFKTLLVYLPGGTDISNEDSKEERALPKSDGNLCFVRVLNI